MEELESAYFMKTGVLPVLSVQQATSCDTNNYGCAGGDPVATYYYIYNYGIMLDSQYPYTSAQSTSTTPACLYQASRATYKLKGWRYASPPCTTSDPTCITTANERALIQAIAAWGYVCFTHMCRCAPGAAPFEKGSQSTNLE